jgi:hypothetical protein
MKKTSTLLMTFLFGIMSSFAQICAPEDLVEVSSANTEIMPSYVLSLPSSISQLSTMSYCSEIFNESHGGGCYINYQDPGGSGMDAYPGVKVGGAKFGGTWHPGDTAITGMPVQIQNVDTTMNFVWINSQENAWDVDDKWMASINFIFDIYGTQNSEPVSEERDFDLVIEAQSHNFANVLEDQPIADGSRVWWFARNTDGSLKPYEVTINDTTYTYAVRYKFFTEPVEKTDKAHVKYIPYGPNGEPHEVTINVSEIVANARDYIQYADIPEPYLAIANEKVAQPDTWIKAINAGYEVYTGNSTLKIDRFKVNPQSSSQDTSVVTSISVSPSSGAIAEGQSVKFTDEDSANDIENAIMVYPNPACDIVTITGVEVATAMLIAINGQIILSEVNNNQLNVSTLPTGMYILRIVTAEEGIITKKLSVEKREKL